MIRKGLKPRFKFGMDLPGSHESYRRVLPFRRSWIAIAVVAIIDIAFLIPAVSAFQNAAAGWSNFDSLFDLTIAVFMSAWLLGWAVAPLSLSLILLIMLFGRETIKAYPGVVEVSIGLPGLGVTAQYDVSKMRNLRLEIPTPKSGKSWRGPHLVIDYGANSVALGSSIKPADEAELKSQIQMASGVTIRHGDALPEEVQAHWEPEEPESPVMPMAETMLVPEPITLASPSSIALIIANLVPIAGTLFLGWNLADVMVLYWAESAVVGFYNLLKIIVIGRWSALFYGPFFTGHFGCFMAVHFLFIYTLFVVGVQNDMDSGGDLSEVWQLFLSLWPALAALFISHTYSFFHNFLGRQEYKGRTVADQMGEPYSRIIFMHLVLIFGGGLSMILGEPTPVLLIVMSLKIYFDLKAHLKQRSGPKRRGRTEAGPSQ